MATLAYWKEQKKALKMTNQEIANAANLPLRTVEQVMCGKVKNPRNNTVQAIERALGLGENKPTLSNEQKKLISLIAELTQEETKDLSSFIDYMVSKRK